MPSTATARKRAPRKVARAKTNGKPGVKTATRGRRGATARAIDAEGRVSKLIDYKPQPMTVARFEITVQGTRPYVSNNPRGKHGLTAKSLREGRVEGADKPVAAKRPKRDPVREFEDSLYQMPDGEGYGIPAGAFKKAMLSALGLVNFARQRKVKPNMLFAVGANVFHTLRPGGKPVKYTGEAWTPNQDLLRIETPEGKPMEPQSYEDYVRTQGIRPVAMLRWRGLFPPGWTVRLPVTIKDVSLILAEEIIEACARAGFMVGVGEGRPEKTSALEYGLFEIVSETAAEAEEREV